MDHKLKYIMLNYRVFRKSRGENLQDPGLYISVLKLDAKSIIHKKENWKAGPHQNKLSSVKDPVKKMKW